MLLSAGVILSSVGTTSSDSDRVLPGDAELPLYLFAPTWRHLCFHFLWSLVFVVLFAAGWLVFRRSGDLAGAVFLLLVLMSPNTLLCFAPARVRHFFNLMF